MNHELKVWPEFYRVVAGGNKRFEIRKNDRNYKVGDNLILLEFEPCELCMGDGFIPVTDLTTKKKGTTECTCNKPHGTFSGNRCDVSVDYILTGGSFGIEKEYVVMSITVTGTRKVYK